MHHVAKEKEKVIKSSPFGNSSLASVLETEFRAANVAKGAPCWLHSASCCFSIEEPWQPLKLLSGFGTCADG
jgi:hypothetical protein